ncbi:MAG: hypothetical protein ACLFOY_06065 [Desulfatibacillaceae bacterium]
MQTQVDPGTLRERHREILRAVRNAGLARHMRALSVIYSDMQHAYDEVAKDLGFVCAGCPDNCCRTLFFQHTLVEWLALAAGLAQLPEEKWAEVVGRAERFVKRVREGGAGIGCPLFEDDLCILYHYRPMVCRLHGLPYRFDGADGTARFGAGCADFHRMNATWPRSEKVLDRTPLYRAMVGVEQRMRHSLGFDRKIKLSVAEMILFVGEPGMFGTKENE